MKSVFFGLSLAGVAAAQVVNGLKMITLTPSATQAPASTTEAPAATSTAFYDTMPYSSYQSGGYKELQCGYGYKKQEDGSCQPESWVRLQMHHTPVHTNLIIFFRYAIQYTPSHVPGCYATTIIK